MITRDKEIWGMAVWVERTQGAAGPDYIQTQIADLTNRGEHEGARLWQKVTIDLRGYA